MIMKYIKTIYIILSLISCVACSNKAPTAIDYLEKAKQLSTIDPQQAIIVLDSIDILFPKDIATRRCGDTIQWNIEYTSTIVSLEYIDSMLKIFDDSIPTLALNFNLLKNEKYQDIGEYEHKAISTEKNILRCHLKPKTDELGNLSITSFYLGTKSSHNCIQLSSNENFIKSEISSDDNRNTFVDNGIYNEITLFNNDSIINLFYFIDSNINSRIKVSLLGTQNYDYYLTQNEKNVIIVTYQLAILLSDKAQFIIQRENLKKKFEYLKLKLNKHDI